MKLLSEEGRRVPGTFHWTSRDTETSSVKICTVQMLLSVTANSVSVFNPVLWFILWSFILGLKQSIQGFRRSPSSKCVRSWWPRATCCRLNVQTVSLGFGLPSVQIRCFMHSSSLALVQLEIIDLCIWGFFALPVLILYGNPSSCLDTTCCKIKTWQ